MPQHEDMGSWLQRRKSSVTTLRRIWLVWSAGGGESKGGCHLCLQRYEDSGEQCGSVKGVAADTGRVSGRGAGGLGVFATVGGDDGGDVGVEVAGQGLGTGGRSLNLRGCRDRGGEEEYVFFGERGMEWEEGWTGRRERSDDGRECSRRS